MKVEMLKYNIVSLKYLKRTVALKYLNNIIGILTYSKDTL